MSNNDKLQFAIRAIALKHRMTQFIIDNKEENDGSIWLFVLAETIFLICHELKDRKKVLRQLFTEILESIEADDL
jgi:hypothetical protein